MDDLDSRLDKLLNDPDLSDKINSVLSSLSDTKEKEERKEGGGGGLPDIDPAVLSALISAAGSNDNDLLRSLSPYLRPSRRDKIKEAQKLMSVLRLLPLINEIGKG